MMIDVRLESLKDDEEKDFRSWLGKAPAQTLIKIAESRMKEHACKALQEAVKAGDSPLKIEPTNAALKIAQSYQTFLRIFEELRQQEKPFVIAKIT